MKLHKRILIMDCFIFIICLIFLNVRLEGKLYAFSGTNNGLGIQVQITYDDQKEHATIYLDTSEVDSKTYRIEHVYDTDHIELTQSPYEKTVDENKTYVFTIEYCEVSTEFTNHPKQKEPIKNIVELNAVVDQIGTAEATPSLPLAPVKEDTMSSLSLKALANDSKIDMTKAFTISGYSRNSATGAHKNDYQNFVNVQDSQLELGNKDYYIKTDRPYQTVHVKSKFKVDFSRSFEITGFAKTPSASPDGVTFGFYNDDSFSLDNGFKNSGGGMGVFSEVPADISYGVHHGIVYEIDTYSNAQNDYVHLNDFDVAYKHTALQTTAADGSIKFVGGSTINDSLYAEAQPYKIVYNAEADYLTMAWTTEYNHKHVLYHVRNVLNSRYANFYLSGVINQLPGYGAGGAFTMTFDEFKYTDVDLKAGMSMSTKKGESMVDYQEQDSSTYPKPGEEVTIRNEIYNSLFDTTEKQTPIRISNLSLNGNALIPYDLQVHTEDGTKLTLNETDIFNGVEQADGLFKTALLDIPASSKKVYVEYKVKIDEQYQGNGKLLNTVFLGTEGMQQQEIPNERNVIGLPSLSSSQTIHFPITAESNILPKESLIQGILGHNYDASDTSAEDPFVDGMFTCSIKDLQGNTMTEINQNHYGIYEQHCTLKDTRYDVVSPILTRYMFVSDLYQEAKGLQISAHSITVTMSELRQHANDLPEYLKQNTDLAFVGNNQKIGLDQVSVDLHNLSSDSSYEQSPYTITFHGKDAQSNHEVALDVPIEVISGIEITAQDITINQAELLEHEQDLSAYLMQLAQVVVTSKGEPFTEYAMYLDLQGFDINAQVSETPYPVKLIITTNTLQITETKEVLITVTPNVYGYIKLPERIELFENQGYVNGESNAEYAGGTGTIQYQSNAYTKQVKISVPTSCVLYPEDGIGSDTFTANLYDNNGKDLSNQEATQVEILNEQGTKDFAHTFRLNIRKAENRRLTHYVGKFMFRIEMITR